MPKRFLHRTGDSRLARGGWWPIQLTAEYRLDALRYLQTVFARLMVMNSGAAAAEYTFLIAFISILAAIGMVLIGDDLQTYFQSLSSSLSNASTPTPDPFAT